MKLFSKTYIKKTRTELLYRIKFFPFVLLLITIPDTIFSQQVLKNDLLVWYDKPAATWEEQVPLGNGKIGMMPDGNVNKESIVLNDITLWSGSPQDANNYEAHTYLPQIRELLVQGKNELAQELIDKHFVCKGPGSGGAQWGCFQIMGNLNIAFDYNSSSKSFSNYKRGLDIQQAKAFTNYSLNGTDYSREYFTSFNNDVGVIRLRASQKGKISIKITLSREERATSSVQNGDLILSGQMDNGVDGKGMKFLTRVVPNVKGGKIDYENDAIIISKADEVELYLCTDTDYKGNVGFEKNTSKQIAQAKKMGFDREYQQHVRKFGNLFNRLEITIGGEKDINLPIEQRIRQYGVNPDQDPGFAALFYQFGRYLSISSTRIGLLPPNLQGLWANQLRTPWNGDYHLDVNVQMNHWHLGAANLSELELPLVDLVKNLMVPGAKTAKAYYNANGWVAHVITNIWGYTEPGESASWGIANAGSGWLCNNLWNHYEYTKDVGYLKEIYPILKGAAQFYNSSLMMHPTKKWYVTAPSVSPENSFRLPNGKHANVSMGPTIDNQIVNELFGNLIHANEVLGYKDPFCDTLKSKLNHLAPVAQIGKDGRILEWLEEYGETDPEHRHISHLYGLYPASLITAEKTPDFAEAAKKVLLVRGDDGPSWAIAYKMIFWARLKDGEHAYKLFKQLMTLTDATHINYGAGGGIYLNLFTAGPPMQIDGNFGGAAGINEMLVHSYGDYIELLPALPKAWSKSGSIKGIKAKGNISIDMKWKDGKVTEYKLYAPKAAVVNLKVNGENQKIQVKAS